VERQANAWLADNPQITVHGVHTETEARGHDVQMVVTIWFSEAG
jgi:hypothetical protein